MVRANLVEFSCVEMPLYHRRIQRMLDVANSEKRRPESKILPISQWDLLYPICPYDALMYPLDGFNVSSNMRYEALVNICGFDLTLNPVQGSTLLKTSGTSTNRPSYLTDIIGLSYHQKMGPEVVVFIASYLAPGEMD